MNHVVDGERVSSRRRCGSGSIYARYNERRQGSVRWVACWTRDDGKRASKSFPTEQAAADWMRGNHPDLVAKETWQHGSAEGYRAYGCRCEICQTCERSRRALWAERRRIAGVVEHGTWNGYANQQCRCAPCTGAARERQRQRAGLSLPAGDARHGTVTGYFYPCRCMECKDAGRVRGREIRTALQAGEKEYSHSTVGYEAGCRCGDCTAVYRKSLDKEVAANRQSRDTASNHNKMWTGPELEIIASRRDKTAAELASLLGRTISAVKCARAKATKDPRWITMAGVTDCGTRARP